jgi:hypothetical protein
MKHRLLFGASMMALTVGSAAVAHADTQQGLVNVYASDTTVQIPIGIAANVCGVDVNVLTSLIGDAPVDCTADGVSIAQDNDGSPRSVHQKGLVNVALVDTTVQVPVSVAANICGVDVNVLAQAIGDAPVDCDALAASAAG